MWAIYPCCIITIVAMTTGLGAAAPAVAAAVHDEGLSQQQGADAISGDARRLHRPKRAEEIMYGNHQNEPRVKKSNDEPTSHMTSQTEVQPFIGNDSKVEAATISSVAKQEPEVKHLASKPEVGDREPIPEVVKEQDGLMMNDGGLEMPEVNPYYQDIDYQTEVEDANGQLEDEQDNVNLYDDSDHDRRKRSSQVSLTAENMADSKSEATGHKSFGGRFKRGLITADDIESWVDSQRQSGTSLDDEDAEEDKEESNSDEETGFPDYANREELFARGRQLDEYPNLDPVESKEDREDDREEENVENLRVMLAKELLAEKAEDQVRDAVLQYLVNADDEPEVTLEEEQVPEPFLEESDNFREPVPDETPVENVDYVPVVYGGVRGIFIPETLPLAPIKRTPIYPSYYEPRGGRWSALTPLEIKRAADSYGRLYHLAEALKQYDEYSE